MPYPIAKNMGRVIFSLALFLWTWTSPALGGRWPVLRVVDGDTLVVLYQGEKEKVRLLCVNTPESVHPDRKRNTPLGKKASRYTKERLHGKRVDLAFEDRKRGRFKRLLAYVFLDGINFNVELVRQGLSPYYTKYGLSRLYDFQFREAEREAREAGRNIWAEGALRSSNERIRRRWKAQRKGFEARTFPPPLAVGDDALWVASASSHKYHRSTCRWAARIRPENRIIFHSVLEALQRGFIPCSVCRPPVPRTAQAPDNGVGMLSPFQ